mmetsp:Transcript_39336/g.121643  ORF Transcript_39336/g.121643 Transcript_39336/m.121643 type:complete len:219 (-) Transcript_39336:54-710(-)
MSGDVRCALRLPSSTARRCFVLLDALLRAEDRVRNRRVVFLARRRRRATRAAAKVLAALGRRAARVRAGRTEHVAVPEVAQVVLARGYPVVAGGGAGLQMARATWSCTTTARACRFRGARQVWRACARGGRRQRLVRSRDVPRACRHQRRHDGASPARSVLPAHQIGHELGERVMAHKRGKRLAELFGHGDLTRKALLFVAGLGLDNAITKGLRHGRR